jgi:uncharacterized surface protein with fasciclin (FAS1) repeats
MRLLAALRFPSEAATRFCQSQVQAPVIQPASAAYKVYRPREFCDRANEFEENTMRLINRAALAAALMLSAVPAVSAADTAMLTPSAGTSGNPMVGGMAMMRSKDIVDNAVNSADHTTLVAAVKAAGLVETLKGPGPFTVFAPTNEAFATLPAGTVETLVKPENKDTLVKILTYHVVSGRLDSRKLEELIRAGHGKAELTTVQGDVLTAEMNGPKNIVLIDDKGDVAQISTYDVYQSNGVIQVIDKVLMSN